MNSVEEKILAAARYKLNVDEKVGFIWGHMCSLLMGVLYLE